MRRPIRFLLGMSALFAAFVASIPAYGQLATTTYGPFVVSCTSVGQLCNNVFSQSVATVSNLQVEYIAAPTHCSNVGAHIIIDGVEKAVTAFLTPGQASGFFNVGPVASGSHVVALQGEGNLSGCNSGTLGGWGGTMVVIADATATSAIPAVSPPMLWLLAAALMLAGGFVIRRRSRRHS